MLVAQPGHSVYRCTAFRIYPSLQLFSLAGLLFIMLISASREFLIQITYLLLIPMSIH